LKSAQRQEKTAERRKISEDDRINAAIVIQSGWRGHRVRKKYKTKSDELTPQNAMAYTILVVIGNRWAAETDQDLFIIIYGEHGKSEKLYLRQDAYEAKFRQNSIDSFHVKIDALGILDKIILGHDRIGYGAGVFIERILIAENIVDGRQFLFQCNKWFDSGQADGKIERTIKITAYYFISSMPDDPNSTKGRWELIIYFGKEDGTGWTTSNLNVIGYGSHGSSATNKIYDSNFTKAPSQALIQVDFGDIGDLLKVRIEIDGNGINPDFFLNKVELKDLDTDEKMVSIVKKWLKFSGAEKYNQPFREFPVFRTALEPLCLLNYEGRLRLGNRRNIKTSLCFMQIIGELSETGKFPINIDRKHSSKSKCFLYHSLKIEVPSLISQLIALEQFRRNLPCTPEILFKAESVYIGRIHSVRIYVDSTSIGEQLYEGMCMLQTIYDNRFVPHIGVGIEWLVERIVIRESSHTPYRFMLGYSRVRNAQEENDIYKELVLSGMEGLPTKISKKKSQKKLCAQWILSITIGEQSTLIPKVTLCSETKNAEMVLVSRTATDGIINFQIVLYDSANGDEPRFSNVGAIMTSECVVEYAAVWPDIPPIPYVNYEITINTGELSGNFIVYLNLIGTKGDTGFRRLVNNETNPLQADSNSVFQVKAVSIGDAKMAEIALRSEKTPILWSCEQIHVLDNVTNLFYVFHLKKLVDLS
uniref:PLAT domain-containing protein n=1 Tax=Dracunculus medinensis TaxID=318479 RepID=A0A0N4UCV5_DRAME